MTEPLERRGGRLGQELCPRLEHIDMNHGQAQDGKQANQGQQRPTKKVEELGAKTLIRPYVCTGKGFLLLALQCESSFLSVALSLSLNIVPLRFYAFHQYTVKVSG